MRILVCHNFYQQPGGEDEVYRAEVALLRAAGHDVATFEADNDQIAGMSKIAALATTLWNAPMHQAVRDCVKAHRSQVVHFHNTFPLISPAGYDAARAQGAAVVQTLHNFRLLCPGANLFRQGEPCEKCIGKRLPWPGAMHRCYRDSASASGAVAAMIGIHHAAQTWARAVDLYLTPTEFARQKFLKGGWPREKLAVKPNFLDPDPGIGPGDGGYLIAVLRLSTEKGVETLLNAWGKLQAPIPLKIVGDGPLAPMVAAAAARMPHIQWLGRRPLSEVCELIGGAAALIVPSVCYETFGRVAVEAYAKGTPVIASRHGAPGEIVRDGATGLLFEPGNAIDLAACIDRAMANPNTLAALRPAARREYETRYTGAANLEMLLAAYERALEAAAAARRARSARSVHSVAASTPAATSTSASPSPLPVLQPVDVETMDALRSHTPDASPHPADPKRPPRRAA